MLLDRDPTYKEAQMLGRKHDQSRLDPMSRAQKKARKLRRKQKGTWVGRVWAREHVRTGK